MPLLPACLLQPEQPAATHAAPPGQEQGALSLPHLLQAVCTQGLCQRAPHECPWSRQLRHASFSLVAWLARGKAQEKGSQYTLDCNLHHLNTGRPVKPLQEPRSSLDGFPFDAALGSQKCQNIVSSPVFLDFNCDRAVRSRTGHPRLHEDIVLLIPQEDWFNAMSLQGTISFRR